MNKMTPILYHNLFGASTEKHCALYVFVFSFWGGYAIMLVCQQSQI